MTSFCVSRKHLGLFFLLVAAVFAIYAMRPVCWGNRFNLALMKDIVKGKYDNPIVSRKQAFSAVLRLDVLERVFGSENVKKIKIGPYELAVFNGGMAKCLLWEVFVAGDYYFPYEANNPFIIDCGANIGFTSVYFKWVYPSAEILAFEPDQKNISLFKQNISNNKLSKITLKEEAVSDFEGFADWFGDSTGSKISDKDTGDNGEKVRVVKLSDYITKPVDILKMDIEGAETSVIRDLVKTNKIKMIKNIIMEFHYKPYDTNKLGYVLNILEEYGFGYQIRHVDGLSRKFNSDRSTGNSLHCLMIYAFQK